MQRAQLWQNRPTGGDWVFKVTFEPRRSGPPVIWARLRHSDARFRVFCGDPLVPILEPSCNRACHLVSEGARVAARCFRNHGDRDFYLNAVGKQVSDNWIILGADDAQMDEFLRKEGLVRATCSALRRVYPGRNEARFING